MVAKDLSAWTPRERPRRAVLQGRFVSLEPLDAARHGDDLYAAATEGDAASRFRYLYDSMPESRGDFEEWLARAQASEDPLYFTVLDASTGKAVGRQSLMRIDTANGVIEIGNIHWGPRMQRSALSTEAFYLHARHIFDELGYRRFEWKCNSENEPSRQAALRFGFRHEGIFRQHLIVKGRNRDTAWYSIVDGEWPALRRSYADWLDEANFDAAGRQRRRLAEFR